MRTVNIHVVDADLPWIIGRMARELAERITGVVINSTAPADWHYYMPVYGKPEKHRHRNIGLFTHGEHRVAQYSRDFDGHVCLNGVVQDMLFEHGASMPIVIEEGVDEIFLPRSPAIFGVAGMPKGDGRKGEDLVQQMVDAGYTVRAWGRGWPVPSVGDDFRMLPAFYSGLDYYVVTSRDEGGCTPIIECQAVRVPVISPAIGFALRGGVIPYDVGNWDSLHAVLHRLTTAPTWQQWADQHAAYFKMLNV